MKTPLIDDYNLAVYGEADIPTVIRELINTRAVDRLKRIQQQGPDCWVWPHANITRFEHSLGVALLLKYYDAPLQEQIAGLLHDISHGAFSHAVDFVYDKQLSADFAEQFVVRVVRQSEIPSILKKSGFVLEEILESGRYPLLEKDAPDLCADRIDYFFRDSYRYGLISLDEIRFMLRSLSVADNQFVFRNESAAFMFGVKYLESAERVFGSKESIFFHTMIANALKIALENSLLKQDDLFQLDDVQIREKLMSSKNSDILYYLSFISAQTHLELDEEHPDYHLKVKTRVVDPKVILGSSVRPLSEINGKYKASLEDSKNMQQKGYFVKVQKG